MKIKKLNLLILTCTFLIPIQTIFGQDTIVFKVDKNYWNSDSIQRVKKRDKFVKQYIDSLNNFKVSENCELPDFFIDKDFDRKYGSSFLFSLHSSISLRKLIIDELTNYRLMWCVMKSDDERLHAKYIGRSRRFYLDYSKIPFDQFSTYELIDLRLDELLNLKSLGKNEN